MPTRIHYQGLRRSWLGSSSDVRQPQNLCILHLVLTLAHRYNAVRGHRTGSNNLAQAGSSIKPKIQIPFDANVHAVFESQTPNLCTRV